MKTWTITSLPPKMAAQYAEKAQKDEDCVKVGKSIWQFNPYGNVVVTIMALNPPMGNHKIDPDRAKEIRQALGEES